MYSSLARFLPLLLLTLALPACGGGGGGDDEPEIGQMTLEPDLAYTWKGDGIGGFNLVGSAPLRVGDALPASQPNDDVPLRSMFQFNRSAVPAGAKITQATLRFHVTGTSGDYQDRLALGGLKADHIDWPLNTLTKEAHATGMDVGTPTVDLLVPSIVIIGQPTPRFANVDAQVLQDVADGRMTSSFRVRTALFGGSLTPASYTLEGFHGPTGQVWKAQLILTYELP